MPQNSDVPYAAFGSYLMGARTAAGIATQKELAATLGATQQTVSRWEKGASRPRERELPKLADVLGVKTEELIKAAGYGSPVEQVTSVDRNFPINGLTPDSFERFCSFLIERLYGIDAKVHRQGESGHKQDGIDISAETNEGTLSFQCKRVQEFGPAKVAKAVQDHSFAADRSVLLLACIASPAARAEIAKHPGWDIWDAEDINRRIRQTLSFEEQRELVRVFFRGKQFDLLGVREEADWLTPNEFFAPFSNEKSLFNHQWEIVGREEELSAGMTALKDQGIKGVFIVGFGGQGKTRLLSELLDRFEKASPKTKVWMATERIRGRSVSNFGDGPKLLVVDDAHERDFDELTTLMRYVAHPESNARTVLAFRPYGREAAENAAAESSLPITSVTQIEIGAPTKAAAVAIASEVLKAQGIDDLQVPDLAKQIADVTYDSPLATVIGAQIVARDNRNPTWLTTHDEFRKLILAKFQDVFTGGIVSGTDVDRLRKILSIVALVQPVLPDQPALLRLISDCEDISQADSSRLLKLLVDAGVLFKRGVRYRLSPDLLAEAIIERECLEASGASSRFAERVFDCADSQFYESILLNLARLDWRLRDGDTRDSKVLDGIWGKLRWEGDYPNAAVRAAAAVAYFQPQRALRFAKELIDQGHGDSEVVCDMLRYAAYNFEFLDEACFELLRAGLASGRTSRGQPAHGIRVLKELASFKPNKPISFNDKVADFAIEALNEPNALKGNYAQAMAILQGTLEVDGQLSEAHGVRAVSFTWFSTPLPEMRTVRAKAISALLELIGKPPVKRAARAARSLSQALRYPRNRSLEEIQEWAAEHVETLTKLLELLTTEQIDSIVLISAAEAVSWKASYDVGASKELSLKIMSLLDRDLETRLNRILMDGWGRETWSHDTDHKRPEFEVACEHLQSELLATFPDAADLRDYLDVALKRLREAEVDRGSQYVFLNELISNSLPLSKIIVSDQAAGRASELSDYSGQAWGVLLSRTPSEARPEIALALRSGDQDKIALIAEAYLRLDPPGGLYDPTDAANIRTIFASNSERVLRVASALFRRVTRTDIAFAVELLGMVDFRAAPDCMREFLATFCHENFLTKAPITPTIQTKLLAALDNLESLDDHWVGVFLKQMTKRIPEEVVAFVCRRLEAAERRQNWRYAIICDRISRNEGFDLLKQVQGFAYLSKLLDWAVHRPPKHGVGHDFGQAVGALCGDFSQGDMARLLQWIRSGDQRHLQVAAAILREVSNRFVFEHGEFVQELLYFAENLAAESVELLTSALFAATVSGSRSGTPGEPFKEDLEMERIADARLKELSRFDPSRTLYSWLLSHAKENIKRQTLEKQAMDDMDADLL